MTNGMGGITILELNNMIFSWGMSSHGIVDLTLSTMITDQTDTSVTPTEPSTGGYFPIELVDSDWVLYTSPPSGLDSNNRVYSAVNFEFVEATAPWGEIVEIGLVDRTSRYIRVGWELPSPVNILTGDTLVILAGNLSFQYSEF